MNRFRAGTRSRQAQSKVKRLEKIERMERDATDGRGPAIAFGSASRTGRVVLELEHAPIGVGGRTLIDDAELWLERGEHVALVGPNGSGKTTLIETLAGLRELSAVASCAAGTTWSSRFSRSTPRRSGARALCWMRRNAPPG